MVSREPYYAPSFSFPTEIVSYRTYQFMKLYLFATDRPSIRKEKLGFNFILGIKVFCVLNLSFVLSQLGPFDPFFMK